MKKRSELLGRIPEYYPIGNNGLPIFPSVNELGRQIKINSRTGKPMQNKNGNPVYNENDQKFFKAQYTQKRYTPEEYIRSFGFQTGIATEEFTQNSNKIRKNNKTGFKYLMQGEKRIKVNSSGQPEKYANGKNVILGEDGYPINNKGQKLKFDVRTGDLVKNKNGNPYVYNPYPGGFKEAPIPPSEIKYRYPPSHLAEPRNTAKSFFYAQGPGQALEPARLGPKSESPLGGFKVHTTPPKSLFKYNNNPAGNNESITAHLFNTGKHKKNKNGILRSLFSKLSLSGKK